MVSKLKEQLKRERMANGPAMPAPWHWADGDASLDLGPSSLFEVARESAEMEFVSSELRKSLPTAEVMRVWRVQHKKRYEEFRPSLRPDTVGNPRWLWHSPSKEDPLTLLGSNQPFCHTFSRGGSYGRGIYFSECASYGNHIVPCRFSELYENPAPKELPKVGDDIVLAGSPIVYEVVQAGCPGVDKHQCLLKSLRWRPWHTRSEDCFRLGDGSAGTRRWQSADVRFTMLACVSIGKYCDYKSAFKPNLEREPDGYDSWGGTEGDLNINQVERRNFEEHAVDYHELYADGARHGRQYIVARDSQCYPGYVVQYNWKRTRPQ